jgi:signal transduction histidine kinase
LKKTGWLIPRLIPRLIEASAGILLVFLATALPAIHFVNGWRMQSEHLHAEAEFYALEASSLISRNPEIWNGRLPYIEGLLVKRDDAGPESLRFLDRGGNMVSPWTKPPDWPWMTRSHPLKDSDVIVGFVEEAASLQPLILESLALAIAGTGVVLLLFYLFRIYPMVALGNALDLLSCEKGRAAVTLQSIGDGVISTDPEGRVLTINRMAQEITGWTQDEAAGRPIDEVYCPTGDIVADRGGVERRIEGGTSEVLDGKGRSMGTVLVFRDVTEKTRDESTMVNAQKLESLGVLAGGIAHEIRNPLSSININISSIERACARSVGLENETKEKIDLILAQMKSAAAKMGLVVQRVMDYSRPFPPRKEVVDLNRVAGDAVRLSLSTLQKREITVSTDLASAPVLCRADAQMIEQVLVNLITNACQAMEGTGGTKFLEVGSSVRERWIVLRVSDSGPGVPLSIRNKVFDPFFTTRKEGSGIGLSFSHRIIADHGGKMRVDTSRWGGAEFRIDLPQESEGSPV